MKFNEMKYERPDMDGIKTQMSEAISALENAKNATEFMPVFQKINQLRSHIQTMVTLAQVRHTINTADPFYDAENSYWDQELPAYQVVDHHFIEACMKAKFRPELLNSIPNTFFQLGECASKSFSPKIVPLMVQENQLCTQYGRLKASAKIPFDGEILNLSQISAKTVSKDRDVRKRAMDAKWGFYAKHEAEFDAIYDQLVHLRDRMAKELGYENYIQLGYYRMNRLDYNAEMVADYRAQILANVTPAADRIFQRQKKRLGYDRLEYYDLDYEFKTGNATPKGSSSQLIADAVEMYHQMSPETGEFIDIMNRDCLWDLESRPNKELGGYTTGIADYKVPFIFSNFNGTSADVDVLTHEAGHAFQGYMSRNIDIPDIAFPTLESCEIHSMSMEFFADPWMNLFFGDEADKYRYSHLCGTITFLPYGALVDHFQHDVYANPDWTPAQRKEDWRRLEKQYQPYKNYDGCDLLEKGCWWYQQGHIFQSPFYYIDYTLAQVCAQQFYIRMNQKDPNTWKDYLHLCSLGGTLSFVNLVREANLQVPFENGCIASVMKELTHTLDQIDDTKL